VLLNKEADRTILHSYLINLRCLFKGSVCNERTFQILFFILLGH